MCGRYTLHGPKSRYNPASAYYDALEQFPDRYNVAPTDVMPIIRSVGGEP